MSSLPHSSRSARSTKRRSGSSQSGVCCRPGSSDVKGTCRQRSLFKFAHSSPCWAWIQACAQSSRGTQNQHVTQRTSSSKPARKRAPRVTDPIGEYARAVVDGRAIAGPHVRDACARHLRDRKTGKKRGLVWDLEAALRAIRFFQEVLRLNGGEHEGKPFVLQPPQQFIVGSLFGWKTVDGFRRFRLAF